MPNSEKKNRQPQKFTGKKKSRKCVVLASYWLHLELMQAILDHAAELDWEIVDERFIHTNDITPDGLLCCQPGRSSPGSTIPTVYAAVWMPDRPILDDYTVAADPKLVGAMAATHFLERRFKEMYFLHLTDSFNEQNDFQSGLQQTFEENGGRFLGHHGVRIDGPDWKLEFSKVIHAWLNKMPRPLAVMTSGDILAGHLLGFCKAQGITVPEEIAVLSIGNRHPWCDMSPCPLSSIDLNPVARGRAAVDLLNSMMHGERPPKAPLLIPPARVVARKSTDIIAAADLPVAKALRFLWEHFDQQISVDDTAKAAGLSRSTLERRFRKSIGRSVNEELLRKRLAHCRELLRTTDLPFVDIAPCVGFISKTYLHRIFLKQQGCTPQQYRKTNPNSI